MIDVVLYFYHIHLLSYLFTIDLEIPKSSVL
jgi:hypothetical protein